MTAKCKHHRWSHECHECDAEWKPPMTPHQTPPSVTDEMVERAAIRLCALDLGNEGFWKTIGEEDRNAYRDEARDVLTAALAGRT